MRPSSSHRRSLGFWHLLLLHCQEGIWYRLIDPRIYLVGFFGDSVHIKEIPTATAWLVTLSSYLFKPKDVKGQDSNEVHRN